MVTYRRLAAWSTFRHLDTGRNALGVQSPASSIAAGFREACKLLRKAGCRLVYLDGSFVTTKAHPGDFDACWDIQHVDDEALDRVFWDFSQGRAAQKRRFLGEFFPAHLPEGATGRAFVEFFQVNKLTGEPKGILMIRLRGSRKR